MQQTRCLVWGNNNQNLLSSAPNQCLTHPQEIVFFFKVLKLAATEKHISFITSDGDVYSYGSNTDGRLGIGAKDSFTCHYRNPVKVNLEGKAKQIKSGFSHTLVQLESNEIYSWGLGEYGSLGVGEFRSKYTPTKVLVPPTIRSISCGAMHTAFIDFDGNMYICGSNEYGELGVKSPDKIGTPILVPFPARIKEVACGVFYTLVLTEDGEVYGMGNNKYAQLGLGHKINEPKPTLIRELTNIVKVEAGYHSGALNAMCELYLWGCGSFGEILRPKKIILNCPLSNLQIRGFFGITISESQNRVFIWGNNTHGELGNGGYISYKTPTEMKELTNTKIGKICCGVNFAIVIVEDEGKRGGYHLPSRIEESRRVSNDQRVSSFYSNRDEVSTGRKRVDYRQQLSNELVKQSHEKISQRTRPLHGYNGHSHSPLNRGQSVKRQQELMNSPQRVPQDLRSSVRRLREQTSATRSIHFPYTNQTERYQHQKDTTRSHSPYQRNYEELFLNLSKDYEALAKRYKELEGQIEEREVRRSRDISTTEAQLYNESQTVKELQLINVTLKEKSWKIEKENIICRQELAVALEKISRLEKQIEILSHQKTQLQSKRSKSPSSPTRSPIKLIENIRNDDLIKQLEEKEEKIRLLEQQGEAKVRRVEIENESRIKKLQEQNKFLSGRLHEEKVYSTEIQARYRELSLRELQQPTKSMQHLQLDSTTVDGKVIEQLKNMIIQKQDTFAKILQQKQTILSGIQRQKTVLEDKLQEEKLYSTEVQTKYRTLMMSIEQTKMENLSLRETLLKSEDRICDIETGMRKMVSDKEYESAQSELIEHKSKVNELQEKLTKTEFSLKGKVQAVTALQEERLKLYNMLEDMKNIEKENKIIADKRMNQEKEKTAKTEQQVKELEVQVKYEKDYSKKLEQKGAELDRMREETVNELNRVTQTLEKEKKRKKELQRQVQAFRTTENELKITRQQLEKQRELNEDYKDKVLKEYKKKDQLIKQMQTDMDEKQAELLQVIERKQTDISRLKQELKKSSDKFDAEKQQVKRLNKQISNKNQQIQNLSEDIQKLERKLKHTKQQVEKEVKEREELAEEVGNLKREQTKTVLEKQEMQKRVLELEKDLTEVQSSLRRQKNSKTEVQNELAELQHRLDALKQQNSYMRSQLDQANQAVDEANKISQQLSNANKQFAENEQNLNKRVQELEARVYELEDQNRSYTPRYDALIERNKQLDERNRQLSDMVNKAIEIQAQSYKENILKEVEVSTNQIITDVEDQKIYKQRFNRKPPQQETLSQNESPQNSFTHQPEVISRVKEQPYTKYMNEKIESHRRRVSESAQKLAGILDLDSGIGSAYSKRADSVSKRVNNDQNYERINEHMESLKSQKDAFMSKINSFAEKMKLL